MNSSIDTDHHHTNANFVINSTDLDCMISLESIKEALGITNTADTDAITEILNNNYKIVFRRMLEQGQTSSKIQSAYLTKAIGTWYFHRVSQPTTSTTNMQQSLVWPDRSSLSDAKLKEIYVKYVIHLYYEVQGSHNQSQNILDNIKLTSPYFAKVSTLLSLNNLSQTAQNNDFYTLLMKYSNNNAEITNRVIADHVSKLESRGVATSIRRLQDNANRRTIAIDVPTQNIQQNLIQNTLEIINTSMNQLRQELNTIIDNYVQTIPTREYVNAALLTNRPRQQPQPQERQPAQVPQQQQQPRQQSYNDRIIRVKLIILQGIIDHIQAEQVLISRRYSIQYTGPHYERLTRYVEQYIIFVDENRALLLSYLADNAPRELSMDSIDAAIQAAYDSAFSYDLYRVLKRINEATSVDQANNAVREFVTTIGSHDRNNPNARRELLQRVNNIMSPATSSTSVTSASVSVSQQAPAAPAAPAAPTPPAPAPTPTPVVSLPPDVITEPHRLNIAMLQSINNKVELGLQKFLGSPEHLESIKLLGEAINDDELKNARIEQNTRQVVIGNYRNISDKVTELLRGNMKMFRLLQVFVTTRQRYRYKYTRFYLNPIRHQESSGENGVSTETYTFSNIYIIMAFGDFLNSNYDTIQDETTVTYMGVNTHMPPPLENVSIIQNALRDDSRIEVLIPNMMRRFVPRPPTHQRTTGRRSDQVAGSSKSRKAYKEKTQIRNKQNKDGSRNRNTKSRRK